MKYLRNGTILGITVLAGLVVLGIWWAPVASHVATFFGFANGQGNSSHYLFWSGAGSDLAYLTFLGGAVAVYRKHNCQRKGCPRIGRHEFTDPRDNVKRNLCWKHHPDIRARQLTAEVIADIQKRRHLYIGKQPGKG